MTVVKKLLVFLASLVLVSTSSFVYATTPSTGNGGASNTRPSGQSGGYVPPNVREGQAREAKETQDKAETKEKQETSIEENSAYVKAKASADKVDTILNKKDPSEADVSTAETHFNIVQSFVTKHKETYGQSSQYQALEQTISNYQTKINPIKEAVKNKAKADKALEKAMSSTNMSDLSKLTSYMYVEEGFFSVEDVFPKIVNSLIQGLFFLVKAIYVLTIIILSSLFGNNVFSQLDTIVAFGAKLFNKFIDNFSLYVYISVILLATYQFLRYHRVSLRTFSFILVWFFAIILYSKSTAPASFQGDYQTSYNLSHMIKAIDTFGSGLSSEMIASFDSLDGSNKGLAKKDETDDAMSAVRHKIFQTIVYEPFLALNFSKTEKASEEDVTKLLETNGDTKKVKELADDNFKDYHQLSWSSIGGKALVVLAALIKGLVICLALIVLGLLSQVFKYLVLILVVFSPLLLILALFPGMEYLIGNGGKKLTQFTLLGALGLAFIRGFLYIDTLIASLAKGMIDVYYWSAIIQGLIWFTIYYCRGLISDLFVRGTLSAMAVKERAQSALTKGIDMTRSTVGRYRKPDLSRSLPPLNPDGTMPSELTYTKQPTRLQTLMRAGKNGIVRGYDRFRYGKDDEAKAFAQHERADFKQRLKDGAEGTKDTLFSALRFERARAGLHDLAGDTDTPVQVDYEARKNRQLEREERKNHRVQIERDWDKFRQSDEGQNLFRQRQEGNLFPKSERQIEREMKTDFKKQRFMDNKVTPLFDKEQRVSEDTADVKSELFKR